MARYVAGTLEIQLLASVARLERDMNSSVGVVTKATAQMERALDSVKTAAASLGLGIGLQQIMSLSDQFTKYTAQLKLASTGHREFAQSMEEVRRIATTAQAELGATGVLYARIKNATAELGVSQKQVANITESVTLALKASGATGAESASAMLQLSQAFGSGTLRGEEFNAVNEAAPRLMKALAEGMGVPIGSLREMAKEGKITSEVMAVALPRALEELRAEAAQVQTIGGAFTVLKNNVMEYVGATAQANGTVAVMSGALTLLANNLQLVMNVLLTMTAVKLGNWLAANVMGLYAQVTASQAAAAATLAKAQANVTATSSEVALTTARMAELRAAALAAEGNVALAITLNGLLPMQARAAAAAEAHAVALAGLAAAQRGTSVAIGAGSAAMAALGGPIGLIITVLGVAATAWAFFGKSAADASKRALDATQESAGEIITTLDKQIAKLRERLELAKTVPGIAQAGPTGTDALLQAQKTINELTAKENQLKQQGLELDILDRAQLLLTKKDHEDIVARLGTVAGLKEGLANVDRTKNEAEWMGKYATGAEKLAAELAKAKKEFNGLIPPEVERRIQEQFGKEGAAKAVAAAAKAAAERKKIADELAAHEKRLRELDAKGWVAFIEAQSKEYEDGLTQQAKDLDAHSKDLLKTLEAMNKAEMDLLEEQLKEEARLRDLDAAGWVKHAEAVFAAAEEADRARAAGLPTITAEIAELNKLTMLVQFETSLLGLNNVERAKAIATRNAEALGIGKTDEALSKLLAAMDSEAAKRKTMELADSITDALTRGFENGKVSFSDFLSWMQAELIKTELRPLIRFGVQSMLGVGSGSTADLGPLGASLARLFAGSTVDRGGPGDALDRSLADNSFSGLFRQYLGDNAPIVKSFGEFAGNVAIGLGIGSMVGRAMGGDDVRPLHSIIGAIVGAYWGAAGSAIGSAAGSIIDQVLNEGLQQRIASVGTGSDYTYGTTGKFGAYGVQRGTDEHFSDADMSQTLNNWFRAIGRLDTEVAKHFSAAEIDRAAALLGSQNPLRLDFGLEHSNLDPEVFATMVRERYGSMFSVIDQQMADLIHNFKGSGEELIGLVVDLATVHDRLTGLRGTLTTLFGQDVGFADIAALKGETEGYTEALQRLAGVYGVTNQIADMLGKTQAEVWGSIGLASVGARERLIELAGGIEKLGSSLAFYYEKFYSTQEQQAATLRTLQQAFSDAGVAMPLTIDGFRAITDGFLGMGDAGAQASASMLALAPAFYAYIQAIEAVDATIKASGDGMASIFGEAITLDDVRGLQQNGEALTATLARITSEFAATNQLLAMFGVSSEQAFGAFGLASEAARAKLIELSGGLDAFAANLSGFYANYFTEIERQQMTLASMTAQFQTWGLAMPQTVQGFRDLVQQQLALGPAGASVVAGLLAMQQAFFDTHQVATAVAGVITEVLGSGGLLPTAGRGAAPPPDRTQIWLDRLAWQEKLDILERRRTQQQIDRENALSAVTDETTRAIMEQVYATQDMIAAMERAAKDMADFGAAMDRATGGTAYRDQFAAWGAANSMASVTAAMPWITSLNQLMTLALDDFGQYSEANRALIIEALNAAGALRELEKAASTASNPTATQPAGTHWRSTGDGFGYWEADPVAADNLNSQADILSQRLEILAITYELTGDKVGALNVLEQQHAIALAALDPSLRDLQKNLWGLEAAAKATADATAYASTKYDLETQLQDALGNTAQAENMRRMKQLAELETDELRKIQMGIWTALDATALRQRTEEWVNTLQDFLRGLQLDSNLSPLTGSQRLDVARSQFIENLLGAQGGDLAARGRFTGDANAYLQEALAMFGRASFEYNAIFRQVQTETQGLIDAGLGPEAAHNLNDVSHVIQTGNDTSRQQMESLIAETKAMRAEIVELRRDRKDGDAQAARNTDKLADATERSNRETLNGFRSAAPAARLA